MSFDGKQGAGPLSMVVRNPIPQGRRNVRNPNAPAMTVPGALRPPKGFGSGVRTERRRVVSGTSLANARLEILQKRTGLCERNHSGILFNEPKKPMTRVSRSCRASRKAMSKPSGKDDPSGITNFHAKRAIP
jgi:hypothetical protein